MKPDPARPEVALGVDVLAPEGYGEIIGAGSVSTTTTSSCGASANTTCPQDAFEWYLDLRRYGSVPTAASAWASSACSPGCAASSTSARRSRTRACCTRIYP